MKLLITLQTEIDSKIVCDKETLKEMYDNSWRNCIYDLFGTTEGFGMFDGSFKLVDVVVKPGE